jgi:hypothetical protein
MRASEWLGSSLVAFLMMSGLAIPAANAAGPPPVSVRALDLYRAFESNQGAADKAYSQRWITVTGNVSSLTLDAFGKPRITFQAQKAIVYCSFTTAGDPRWKSVHKGQEVSVTGKVTGKGFSKNMVVIENCSFAPTVAGRRQRPLSRNVGVLASDSLSNGH